MKINFTIEFKLDLIEIVDYISKDKTGAANKFKNQLLQNLKKDLKNPYIYKKSIHFNQDNYRDYIYKGYAIVLRVDDFNNIIYVIGIIKNKLTF